MTRDSAWLDATDAKLLSLLTINARLSNRVLADAIGLSPSAALARRRRLEEVGTIRGYTIMIDPAAHAHRAQSVIIVHLAQPSGALLARFESLIGSEAEIDEVLRVTGDGAYCLRLSSQDGAAWSCLADKFSRRDIEFSRAEILGVLERVKPRIAAIRP